MTYGRNLSAAKTIPSNIMIKQSIQNTNRARSICRAVTVVSSLVLLATIISSNYPHGSNLGSIVNVDALASSRVDKASLALDAVSLLMGAMKQETENPQGRFIYAASNDGCLDGGKRSGWHENAPFPYHNCPSKPHLKWRFDGRYLRMNKAFWHFDNQEGCLDCSYGNRNCEVIVHKCVGGSNQQWFIKVFPHQVDTVKRRVSFSIMHHKHSNQCLTLTPRDIHTFDHKDCEAGAHAAGAFSFGTAYWAAFGDCCMRKPTIRWDSYSLRDCTGSVDQSFYLDRNWFDELDKLGSEMPIGRK